MHSLLTLQQKEYSDAERLFHLALSSAGILLQSLKRLVSMEFISRQAPRSAHTWTSNNQTEKREREMGRMSMTHTESKIHQNLGLNDRTK